MKVAVWDTYVDRKDGSVMHFDIIAPDHIKDETIIIAFGNDFLQSKGRQGLTLTSKECSFCHIEQANLEMLRSIEQKGYYILEMENCES